MGLPEDHIGFGDGGVRGEEGDDGMGIGGGEGGEESRGVKGSGVEEVGGVLLR